MIEKYSIFNSQIIKCKVPKHLYKDPLLNEDVHKFFNSKEVIEQSSICPEKNGKGLTTCSFPPNHMLSLRNINPLINNISLSILKYYFKETESKLKYHRMWMNKMDLGSFGSCHTHVPKNISGPTGTAIFYFDVPKNSSKLIILKENIGNISVTDDHKSISHYLEVKTGDLIIHPSDLPHAVSKHENLKPRICFVFDFQKQLKYF